MSRHKRAFCALCIIVMTAFGHAARDIDKAESSRQAKTPHHKAVQAADSHQKVQTGKKIPKVVQLGWSPVPEAQSVLALPLKEVPPPPDYAGQLAALASQNSVVQYYGKGYANDVAVQLNGTVIISARDAWSPVLVEMKRLQPSIATNDAPTAYAYRGDLMCGIYNVGSCALTGQLLARQTIAPAWDSLVRSQCILNSNAGVSCDRQFKKGMRVQAEGLAAVTIDSNGIIQKIDAMGLAVTSIYYSDGGSTSLIGGLLNAVTNTLQYTGGDLNMYVVGPTSEGSYRGNATFNLQKTLPAGSS